jgi:hypothetical protein
MARAFPNPQPELLPALTEIFPRQQQQSGLSVGQDPALAKRLLAQVEQVPPAWHRKLLEAAA